MSFQALKPYFKARLDAANSGALKGKEWADAFNVDNIPSTALDGAYHIEIQPATYLGTAHGCLGFTAPVRVRAFFKGYKTAAAAIDKATLYADSIIKECCKATQRLNQPLIKNILPNSVDIKALGESNDNTAYLDLLFDCQVIIDPDN
jgi:hypothetical protein